MTKNGKQDRLCVNITFPRGEADCRRLSYTPENKVARTLYRSFGFEEAERMPKDRDEIPAVLKL